MKLRNFFILALIIAAAASCKPSYKATDRTGTTTDTTATATDTTTRTMDTPPATDTMATNRPSATGVNVPPGIQSSFTTQYPTATSVVWSNYDALADAPIDWEMAGWAIMDTSDYVVQFTMDNENYYAWYDSDGNWIGSTYNLSDHAKLPSAAHTAIKNKYADYTITDVDVEMTKDNKTAYEVKLKKADDSRVKLLVDADGNILKEKMK